VRVIEERGSSISQQFGREREETSSYLSKHACTYLFIISKAKRDEERRKTWEWK
jgi:hypothetical protein